MRLDRQWGFLTHTATTALVSSYHPFAEVTRNHHWICRSHSADPPSYPSCLCQIWIWSSVPDVMQKNTGFVDKTFFLWLYHSWPSWITATESYEDVSICCTVTPRLWFFYELLKHTAVAHELPTKVALTLPLFMWMTDQEILTHAVLSLLALLAPTQSPLGIF